VNTAFTRRYVIGVSQTRMNMDFPHPRQMIGLKARRSNFAALMATVSARQAASQTAQAMLAHSGHPAHTVPPLDPLGGRIAYFGSVRRKSGEDVFGAFLPHEWRNEGAVNKDESAVYLDGSMVGKFDALNQSLPVDGQALRGREV
jgi:hypothetical protein